MIETKVGRMSVVPMDDGLSFYLCVEHQGGLYTCSHSLGVGLELRAFAAGCVESFDPWDEEEARYGAEAILGRPPVSEEEMMDTAQMFGVSCSMPLLPPSPEHWLWRRIWFGDRPTDDLPSFLPREARPSAAEITRVCKEHLDKNGDLVS